MTRQRGPRKTGRRTVGREQHELGSFQMWKELLPQQVAKLLGSSRRLGTGRIGELLAPRRNGRQQGLDRAKLDADDRPARSDDEGCQLARPRRHASLLRGSEAAVLDKIN